MKIEVVLFLLLGLMSACSPSRGFTPREIEDREKAQEQPIAEPVPSSPVIDTPAPPMPAPISPTNPSQEDLGDLTPLWEKKISGSDKWTDFVYQQLEILGDDLLEVIPVDSSLFCPQYKKLSYAQRKSYWAFMLSAMVRFESNFQTEAKRTENFTDSDGQKVVSRGLLQISIKSGNAYGCGFVSSQDLHDPLQNLACGIRIINRWVGRDGRIAGKVNGKWQGIARYWSVLRESNKTSYKSILQWSQDLSICK